MGNSRGKEIEHFLANSNFSILNNGSPTHFSTHNTFTHVDLTIISSQLIPNTSCSISKNLHGSDHFPILTSIRLGTVCEYNKPPAKFLTDRADWDIFQNKVLAFLNSIPRQGNNINKEAAVITKALRFAANLSIPQTKNISHKSLVPWWNAEIGILRKNKQHLWNTFRKYPSDVNLISYRKARAVFRKKVKEAKRESFQKFTTNINPNSTSKKIWADIKTPTGNYTSHLIKTIDTGFETINDPREICEHFGKTWSNYSSNSNFSVDFLMAKL